MLPSYPLLNSCQWPVSKPESLKLQPLGGRRIEWSKGGLVVGRRRQW